MLVLEGFSQTGLGFALHMFFLLLTLIFFDIITRWLKAFYIGDLNSAKNFKGYIRKTTIILIVFLFFAIDVVLLKGMLFLNIEQFSILGIQVKGVPFITIGLIVWTSLGELLSIIENLGHTGIKIPKFIKRFIRDLQENIDEGKRFKH